MDFIMNKKHANVGFLLPTGNFVNEDTNTKLKDFPKTSHLRALLQMFPSLNFCYAVCWPLFLMISY